MKRIVIIQKVIKKSFQFVQFDKINKVVENGCVEEFLKYFLY